MIEVHGLSKRYGDRQAVDDISFEVAEGEAFALLGPNGAGKSTTIHMLMGALAADAGQIRIDGLDDPTRSDVQRRIGLAPQDLAVYEDLTAEENLRYFGGLYGLSGKHLSARVSECLDFAGLTERRKERVKSYSGGMKRRLNLVVALVHEPRVLLLDEPTVGVDPQSRNHIFDSIETLRERGLTLLYTTHYMEEAERLCSRVAIMDQGRVLAHDSVDGLIALHGGQATVEAELAGKPEELAAIDFGEVLEGSTLEGRTLRIQTDEPLQAVARLSRAHANIDALRVEKPNLERVFLALTGRSLRD